MHLTTKWYEEDDFITYCSTYTQLKNMNLDIIEEIGSFPCRERTLNGDSLRKCAFMFLCMAEYQQNAFGNLLVPDNIRDAVHNMQIWLDLPLTNYEHGAEVQMDPFCHFVKVNHIRNKFCCCAKYQLGDSL